MNRIIIRGLIGVFLLVIGMQVVGAEKKYEYVGQKFKVEKAETKIANQYLSANGTIDFSKVPGGRGRDGAVVWLSEVDDNGNPIKEVATVWVPRVNNFSAFSLVVDKTKINVTANYRLKAMYEKQKNLPDQITKLTGYSGSAKINELKDVNIILLSLKDKVQKL